MEKEKIGHIEDISPKEKGQEDISSLKEKVMFGLKAYLTPVGYGTLDKIGDALYKSLATFYATYLPVKFYQMFVGKNGEAMIQHFKDIGIANPPDMLFDSEMVFACGTVLWLILLTAKISNNIITLKALKKNDEDKIIKNKK